MKIILSGSKGVGKDTFADILVEDYNFIKCAFADKIREQVKFLLQLKNDKEYDIVKRSKLLTINHSDRKHLIKEHLIDGRHLVREIGMLMLSYDQHQFTKYVVDIFDHNENVVVTDMRFEHELAAMQRVRMFPHIKFIKICNSNIERDGHITEKGFSDKIFDNIIDNSEKNLDHLKQQVAQILKGNYV